jgi:2-polyprenyl-6-methoxyphenol hydroxylase-like FAD-dependent oxidoreductase
LKKDGTVLWEDNGDRGETEEQQPVMEGETKFIRGRPEVDRQVLKDLLISSLPKDTIRWATKVTSVFPVQGSKQWKIEFEDRSQSAAFDLVVGADGVWSRTRRLLTDQQPFFSGVTALDVWVDRVDEAAPDVSAFVGLGNCFMWDESYALLFQRSGQGREAQARCYACVRTDLKTPPSARELLGLADEGGETEEVDWTDRRTRERFIERHFGDWFPEAKRMFLAMTENPALRPLYMLPVGLKWESRPGVTLLGDAAHLMTPFAGVGVNTAMMDALELADGIVNCVNAGSTDGDALAVMLQGYERGMFDRSGQEAARTDAAMRLQFQRDGGERMIDVMSNGLGPENAEFE